MTGAGCGDDGRSVAESTQAEIVDLLKVLGKSPRPQMYWGVLGVGEH